MYILCASHTAATWSAPVAIGPARERSCCTPVLSVRILTGIRSSRLHRGEYSPFEVSSVSLLRFAASHSRASVPPARGPAQGQSRDVATEGQVLHIQLSRGQLSDLVDRHEASAACHEHTTMYGAC